jgi:hypothetical protein
MFLEELIRLEGRGDFAASHCPYCGQADPSLRCMDCDGGELVCLECTLKSHARLPLHRIEVSFLSQDKDV